MWRWERTLVWTSLSALITISITFHVNNWGQQYECLSGEAVWKCVAFLTYLNNDHILHLSMVASYSLHLPVWWFGTARNLFYEIVVFMHTSNLKDKVSNLDIWEEFRVIPLHWKQFVEMVWTFDLIWRFFSGRLSWGIFLHVHFKRLKPFTDMEYITIMPSSNIGTVYIVKKSIY